MYLSTPRGRILGVRFTILINVGIVDLTYFLRLRSREFVCAAN